MNTFIRQFAKQVSSGLAITLAVCFPAIADDTEIYIGSNATGNAVRPNVLFIVDTSGSMSGFVTITSDYDPLRDYSVEAGACFNNNRVYYSRSGNPSNVSCGTGDYFNRPALVCDAANTDLYGAAATGFHTERYGRRRTSNDRWYSLNNYRSRRNWDVECQGDSGIHGQNGASAAKYARNGSGGWTTVPGQELNWSNYRSYSLFAANFLNYVITGGGGSVVIKDRLDIVKDVVTDLVNSSEGINIGLMAFNNFDGTSNDQGGRILEKIGPIETTSPAFLTALAGLVHAGNTPLSESLNEAAKYFRGEAPRHGIFGDEDEDPGADADNTNDPLYDTTAISGGVYETPIEYQCQHNAIILLTDGQPTNDSDDDADIAATIGSSCSGNCLDELAGYLASEDQSGAFADDQHVNTYTIGFQLDHPLLLAAGTQGGGLYRTADNALELNAAFNEIINQILDLNATFSSPAVSVNAFSQTTHRNELYFTLFQPATTPFWDGNLKKYLLQKNGSGVMEIQDGNGDPAVSPITGFFKTTSQSFWSAAVDGEDVPEGGAASILPPDRNVYTYTGGGAPSEEILASVANRFHESNAAITDAILGTSPAPANPDRSELINWARGQDQKLEFGTPERPQLGDPLHAQASVIQYGGTDANPDLTLFFGTNDGFLHAIDDNGATAAHRFSFIPKELLSNLVDIYDNSATSGKIYGLDGPISSWTHDTNDDGIITAPSDHVYIYFGMRRGGNNYYALDVTDRDSPRLKWRVTNDTDGDGTPDGDFMEMGQSWSQPVVRNVLLNGVKRTVVFVSGGYDDGQDASNLPTNDAVGRALYMIDAETGARLWWAGPSGSGADLQLNFLTNSIPSQIDTLDISGDGTVNRLYFGDTRAQYWRIDIDPANTGSANFAKGGRIAVLGGAADTSARRFYHRASIGLNSASGTTPFLAIQIGSGWRAHPLDTVVQDRIYMLRDDDVFRLPNNKTTFASVVESDYLTIASEADLFDTTNNIIGEGTAAQRQAAEGQLALKQGWFIELKEPDGTYLGEKVLADAAILDGFAIIPTYRPSIVAPISICGPNAGAGRAYMVNVEDGYSGA